MWNKHASLGLTNTDWLPADAQDPQLLCHLLYSHLFSTFPHNHRTPTWRLPVALRLSNARCFSELRMQVAYMESSYFCQPPHCCVEQARKFGPDKHRLVACGCSGSTVAVSPPVQPSFLHLLPQPPNPNMEIASCFKT